MRKSDRGRRLKAEMKKKNNKVLIIAEAGINHMGNLDVAKKLVDLAKSAQVDIVKFQMFVTSNLATEYASKADYQKSNIDDTKTQHEMLKELEFNKEEWLELFNYCIYKKIEFLSTAFDAQSLLFLVNMGMKRVKIPSGEITNLPFLQLVGSLNLPTILSTGMSSLEEVSEAVEILLNSGLDEKQLTILHCTSEYPTPYERANLNSIRTLQGNFNFPIGYSDHTLGFEASLVAVGLGATIIEKHFTLSSYLPGPDHKSSLTGDSLKEFVKYVRNAESAMGSLKKEPTIEEINMRVIARKSIVAKTSIQIGEEFSILNLDFKRPGDGISPMKMEELIGKKATKNFKKDEQITL